MDAYIRREEEKRDRECAERLRGSNNTLTLQIPINGPGAPYIIAGSGQRPVQVMVQQPASQLSQVRIPTPGMALQTTVSYGGVPISQSYGSFVPTPAGPQYMIQRQPIFDSSMNFYGYRVPGPYYAPLMGGVYNLPGEMLGSFSD
jgi:hypothetical protein